MVPFGVLKRKKNQLLSIEEKPIIENLVCGGLYLFEKECMRRLSHNKAISMPELLTALIENNCKVNLYIERGYWVDAGTPEQLIGLDL